MSQVQELAPSSQLPVFERLLTRCAALPWAERRLMRRHAHDIVRADGRLSLVELWRFLLLDHVLDLDHESVLRETHVLSLPACAGRLARSPMYWPGNMVKGVLVRLHGRATGAKRSSWHSN